MHDEGLPQVRMLVVLMLLLLMTWLCYAPGLHGGFLFDDFSNLPALGATGPVDTWPTFWRYVTSGTADPTGRPLTLLTFLLDAHDWPADAYPFKRTSLLLHLLNGVLLTLLLRKLGHFVFKRTPPHRVELAAVIGACFWLLHPLFVSTTLYIVQREAMLPATFTLLGLLAWLAGRTSIKRGDTWRGLVWIAVGLGGCTLFGVLSKANGILLPALALVVEYVLLRPASRHAHSNTPAELHQQTIYARSMLLMAWLPTLIVLGYLVQQGWNGFTYGISSVRPWTLGQRLLTEPRVLLDYLDLLWLPRPFTAGLFNDHVQASVSLWSPATTLPALLAVLGLIAGAWHWRRRFPALALAILFFFVGQALESSTVALELYFEHRNYLPAMLMFWPLALWLCGVGSRSSNDVAAKAAAPGKPNMAVQVSKFALTALTFLGLGLMTHARASLWGNSYDQALLWAHLNPDSPRAQASAAQAEMDRGQPARAIQRLLLPLAKAPDQVQLALNLFGAQCQLGHISPSTLGASRQALRTTRDPGSLLTSWFERAIGEVARSPCPELTYATLDSLLQSALSNQYLATNPGRQQDIHYLIGRLALSQGHAGKALAAFNFALDKQVRISAALKQAALLGASGFPQQGLDHLDHLAAEPSQSFKPGFGMSSIHQWVLERQQYWPKELAQLRATLRDDAAKESRSTP
jgi:hypothetical protein